MRILFVNVPHEAIGSRLAGEHLPPLGLLAVAGPLVDAGHNVQLLDADHDNLRIEQVAAEILRRNPDVLLFGHSGSTSAQPIIEEVAHLVREQNADIKIILGGVFPTFHWEQVLRKKPQIDYIVIGEGEATCLNLMTALANGTSLETVKGIAYRSEGNPVQTPPAPVIENLDDYRIAWELMEGYNYTYWGRKKAAVVQFSRGCPFPCVYCGQSVFWKRWRHRDPQRFADELEMLHKKYGIEVFNFADENMPSNPKVWKEFLEALIAKNLKLTMIGTVRTDSIVRDADILHLYKKAGFVRFLLGIEHCDASVLKTINKASDISTDKEAIRLLRQHGILSLATYIIGFRDETIGDFYRHWRLLLSYDPDQIMTIFVTPHRWTPYFESAKEREVILTDLRKWDYKHQVLKNKHLPPWGVMLCSKLLEVMMQARPKALWRILFHKDASIRRAMRWYTRIGRNVYFWELYQFFFVVKLTKDKMTLGEFWE
ncbi:MAG: magnesium-protoporphyrin IX monomethyl ester anaerobic oxidative cyclase [Planctomycetaceae bacterium]|nr:magnesium-protoporphyrin IX monomethyl ester anaerobic oxidative cyclase [Planctomycetaceae bacterium]